MRDFVLSPSMAPPRSSHSSHGSNISMLFYGLAVVGIAAVVLALYNVIFVRLCMERRDRATVARRANLLGIRAATSRRNLLSSFKYRKENDNEMGTGKEHGGGVNECVVCLSAFEEGEEVRRMPRCKHSFHADCIDMWLQSHSDCPLCRTDIHSPPLSPPFYHHRQTVVHSPENAPAVLPVSDTPV